METPSDRFDERKDIPPSILPPPWKKTSDFVLFDKVQGALRHVPNFAETCKAILDAIIDETRAENCSLMLREPTSKELFIRAARGKKELKAAYYSDPIGSGTRFKPGEGIAGWVLEKGLPLLLNDVNKEPRFIRTNGSHDHVRSLICVPIREKDQVVGVLNLSHSEPEAFDSMDTQTLAYVSCQVGAALVSAQFFLEIHGITPIDKDPNGSHVEKEEGPIMDSRAPIPVSVGEMPSTNGIFLYASEKMRGIKEIIEQVANTDVTVLVHGESGVGKEVVARSIHENSLRRDRPFVKVNCAAIPQDLLESEFFGYEKGAFTGAYRQKLGKFEIANGGTIFLDEIVEIPLLLQAKLLQVLQDREFARLGGKKDVRVDMRVIAATNKNLEEFVRNGQFREDLYYRINVVEIHVPPLRDRREEIPVFIKYFLDKFNTKYNKIVQPLEDHLLTELQNHHWPGNVRELENTIHRLVVLGNKGRVPKEWEPLITKDQSEKPKQLPLPFKDGPSLRDIHRLAIQQAESEVIRKSLYHTKWNRKKASELLNISYKALLYKIKEYGIHKE
jgi:transcriptional regulator with GAF, ATPase, and Fis domain